MADITVIVPVWDSYVAYLPEAVSSLLRQEPVPQLVIVDNCSAMPLPAIGDVRLIRTPVRLSIGAARSYGLRNVDSEFVLFWDADDVMPPETMSSLAAVIHADVAICLVAARIAESATRRHHWPRRMAGALANYPRLFTVLNAVSSQVPTIGALMRTSAVRAAGAFPDMDAADDWVLGVSMCFRGRIRVVDQVGRIYRQHGDSLLAHSQTPEHLFDHSRAVRARIAEDPAAPAYARQLLPAIGFAQWLVIRGLRPVTHRARALIRGVDARR